MGAGGDQDTATSHIQLSARRQVAGDRPPPPGSPSSTRGSECARWLRTSVARRGCVEESAASERVGARRPAWWRWDSLIARIGVHAQPPFGVVEGGGEL